MGPSTLFTLQPKSEYSQTYLSVPIESSNETLGIPTKKQSVHWVDVLAGVLSLLLLAVGIGVIQNETLSWYLGQGTDQLIVIGFILSIMSVCLSAVTPTVFLRLETRFGQSKLQNYEAILRNQLLGSKVTFHWRLLLAFMTALPIGLSVAYKKFTGGTSARLVDAVAFTSNDSYYGMFAPPGVMNIGSHVGITLFYNATTPFVAAVNLDDDTLEPPSLSQPNIWGYNLFLVDNVTAAVLDMPYVNYISSIQSLLADGELWNVSATVFATVATYNTSQTSDPEGWNSTFMEFCNTVKDNPGAVSARYLFNDWQLQLVDDAWGNQTSQYLGIGPGNVDSTPLSCSTFSQYAFRYDVTRRQCHGSWSISRGDIELTNATCNDTILSDERQVLITNNIMYLGAWFTQPLAELLGPLSNFDTPWAHPYRAMTIAAMVWGRIIGIDQSKDQDPASIANSQSALASGGATNADIGFVYPAMNELVYYIRPTLRKSVALYFILALQPFLVMICLVTAFALQSTPIGRGFGLAAILAGINSQTLGLLEGATLSGKLSRDVKLVARPLHPLHDDSKPKIEYTIVEDNGIQASPSRISRNVYYH
ncbi:hypothetical protein F4860DRAFT_490160 [Xylaria cubensis]|nr:hypothetical protein F4860DRAFT_490160 [Xylaria cubensis]